MVKKVLLVAIVVLAASAAAFANGAKEQESVTGTVLSVTPREGDLVIRVSTADGVYNVKLSADEVVSLGIAEGQTVTLKGFVVEENEDGIIELEARSLERDGVAYRLDDDGDDDGDDDNVADDDSGDDADDDQSSDDSSDDEDDDSGDDSSDDSEDDGEDDSRS